MKIEILLKQIRLEKGTCSVRLAGPGREILILEIMGSNPIPSTSNVSPAIMQAIFFSPSQKNNNSYFFAIITNFIIFAPRKYIYRIKTYCYVE